MTEDLTPTEKLLFFLAGVVIRAPLDAWAFWLLWGWFAVPLGAPSITFLQAVGLDLLIGLVFLCALMPTIKTEFLTSDPTVWMLSKSVPILITVGIGWIVHLIQVSA